MSNFFAARNEREPRPTKEVARPEAAAEIAAYAGKPAQETMSTIGAGMQVVGNIVCAGSLQIHGQVDGDIHATQLVICEGARVEGKIIAPDAVIRGAFNGTIHGNVVKLQKTAAVEGEIFNKSLAIEQDARFEGVARRLDHPVAGPTREQIDAIRAGNGAYGAPAALELRPDQARAPAVTPVA